MCGIAGLIGGKSKAAQKAFNPYVLKYLMIRQDSRGRDSCGLYYKGLVENEEGKGEVKDIIEWGWGSDPEGPTKTLTGLLDTRKLEPFKGPHLVIAHSRKSSVGGAGLDNSHPFKCGNIVGVHNGTVRNIDDLMEYLDVDTKDIDTDSEAIFKAISEGKTNDVLKGYSGAATLVWTEIGTNYTYIFCGTGQFNQLPDRVFHIWDTKAGLYFSSEKDPLEVGRLMCDPEFTNRIPVQVPVNTILKFEYNELVEETKIERDIYYKSTFTSARSGNGKRKKAKNVKHLPKHTSNTSKSTNTTQGGITEKNVNSGVNKNLITKLSTNTEIYQYTSNRLEGLEEEDSTSPYFRLSVKNGLYFKGSILLHSDVYHSNPYVLSHIEEHKRLGYYIDTRYFVDDDGYFYHYNYLTNEFTNTDPKSDVKYGYEEGLDVLTQLFFYNGIMLRDEKALQNCYEILVNTSKKANTSIVRLKGTTISKFALHPVWECLSRPDRNVNTYLHFGNSSIVELKEKGKHLFHGYFKFPFTDTVYKFEKGVPCSYIRANNLVFALEEFDKEFKPAQREEEELAFNEYRETYDGDVINFTAKCNGIYNDAFSAMCTTCSTMHTFSRRIFELVPNCLECGTPMLIKDEKHFPTLEKT